jgi:rubrerythrin
MNIVADLTLDALAKESTESFENYADALKKACSAYPPPYGMAWYGEKYRSVAVDPSWLANSLIANAQKEGEGSRGLWNLVAKTEDKGIAEQVRQHAIDEARHAKLYIKMLEIVFPEAVNDEILVELFKLSPGFSTKDFPEEASKTSADSVLDELIQMNIGEIRTRIHQLLMRPVINAHCSPDERKKLERILDSLIDDETRHIQYTARLIEQFMTGDKRDFVYRTMDLRLTEFNEITLREVGESTFEGG